MRSCSSQACFLYSYCYQMLKQDDIFCTHYEHLCFICVVLVKTDKKAIIKLQKFLFLFLFILLQTILKSHKIKEKILCTGHLN